MLRLLKAGLFRLSRDLTFKITLIVGVVVAFLFVLINAGFDYVYSQIENIMASGEGAAESEISAILNVPSHFLTGQSMLIGALTPTGIYGIGVSINLVIFVVLEFNQGTIRNKIIGGHSKIKVYISLVISGLILAFLLMLFYTLFSALLGTLFGGFNLEEIVVTNLSNVGRIDINYIIQMLIIAFFTYTTVVVFAILITSLFRSVGPSIAVILAVLILLGFISGIFSASSSLPSQLIPVQTGLKWFNPFYAIDDGSIVDSDTDTFNFIVENSTYIPCLISNVAYSIGLTALGAFIFNRRDIK